MYATTEAAQELVNKLNTYGVQASGEVVTAEYHDSVESGRNYTLAELYAEHGRISRVRLLTERTFGGRFHDVSYIHGFIPGEDGGRTVRISLAHLPQSTLIPANRVKQTFIEWGKAEGVFAKGLGLLDEGNWSVLY